MVAFEVRPSTGNSNRRLVVAEGALRITGNTSAMWRGGEGAFAERGHGSLSASVVISAAVSASDYRRRPLPVQILVRRSCPPTETPTKTPFRKRPGDTFRSSASDRRPCVHPCGPSVGCDRLPSGPLLTSDTVEATSVRPVCHPTPPSRWIRGTACG